MFDHDLLKVLHSIDGRLAKLLLVASDINAKLSPVGATGGHIFFRQKGTALMPDNIFNPATPVIGSAHFTKPDPANPGGVLPGQIDGPAVWASDNPNDVIALSADSFTATIDGTKNVNGENSNITVTGDGDLGPGKAPVVLTAAISWRPTVDIESTGGSLTFAAAAG